MDDAPTAIDSLACLFYSFALIRGFLLEKKHRLLTASLFEYSI